MKVGRL